MRGTMPAKSTLSNESLPNDFWNSGKTCAVCDWPLAPAGRDGTDFTRDLALRTFLAMAASAVDRP